MIVFWSPQVAAWRPLRGPTTILALKMSAEYCGPR